MNTSREANCEGGVQTPLPRVYCLSCFQVCQCVLTHAWSNKAPDTPQRVHVLMIGVGKKGRTVSSQSCMRSALSGFHIMLHNIKKENKAISFTVALLLYLDVVLAWITGRLYLHFVATCKCCFQSAAAVLWTDADTNQCADSRGERLSIPIINLQIYEHGVWM